MDDAARGVIERAGHAEHFVHRTGHSIGQEIHGNGANMDNLETHDVRRVLPRTCFSVEPGIYLPEFGRELETRYGRINWLHALDNYMEKHPPSRYSF